MRRRELLLTATALMAGRAVPWWCVGTKAETAAGVSRVREHDPEPRVGAGLHRTP
jgi:hypothetical protein